LFEKKDPHSTQEWKVNEAAHYQFNSDSVVDKENLIFASISYLNCQQSRALFDRSLIAAQYDGWLAASILKLPVCMKVKTIGTFIQTLQCVKKTLSFETVTTSCGPQPVYAGNYTISKSGWELTRFKDCYWNKDSVVNFNGVPYGSSNKTWKKLSGSEIEPHQEIIHKFR